ncbi:MAG TPA: ATP-binding protein [Thermoanaerobaculia bacterium]|nr:ATP-binding protein [Thermoanaerobaculia bacterium]
METGRLRVHDPFELIRWLALSQPDPRKALAELVQNSLDAGAHTIRVVRRREKGRACLVIWDDGEGVIPELDRPEALRHIATHIGHSRKRSLTPQQRLELLTQGQYGIGLLGFWSLGEVLEMRTSVPGQRPYRLVLYRDRGDYTIEPLRGGLPLDARWTEVVVLDLHREAMPALIARRAADYLGSELRGQLLQREVRLVIEDHIARGAAQKVAHVRPRRFLGERLDALGPLAVPGHPSIQLELYLLGDGEEPAAPGGVAVYAAGTLVAEGFHELAALDLDHEPWTDPRLAGLVEFPALRVAPGSRRGIIPDEAAGLFAQALRDAEQTVGALLESYERRRAQELDRGMFRDLQRLFRDFFRHRPRYAALPVEERDDGGAAGVETNQGAPAPAPEPLAETPLSEPEVLPPAPFLFPPGPLAEVKILPSLIRLECGTERHARALAVDVSGRPVEEVLAYAWRLSEGVGELLTEDDASPAVTVRAGDRPGKGSLAVVCRSGAVETGAEARVEIVEQLAAGREEGIPEPELLDLPGAPWRSRVADGRWQVNSGHPEYRAIADRPPLKLRYLALLFAKEVVLRSSGDPRFEAPLEQLVEVAAYADRRLSASRGRRRKGVSAPRSDVT